MKCWIILKIKVEISGEKRAAPEGPWVLGGGSEKKKKLHKDKANLKL